MRSRGAQKWFAVIMTTVCELGARMVREGRDVRLVMFNLGGSWPFIERISPVLLSGLEEAANRNPSMYNNCKKSDEFGIIAAALEVDSCLR